MVFALGPLGFRDYLGKSFDAMQYFPLFSDTQMVMLLPLLWLTNITASLWLVGPAAVNCLPMHFEVGNILLK